MDKQKKLIVKAKINLKNKIPILNNIDSENDTDSENENDIDYDINELNKIEEMENKKQFLERLIDEKKYINKIENKTLLLKNKYNTKNEISFKVKPFVLDCKEENFISIFDENNFKKFIREIDYQFHEIILLNKYIKPYFDFDNGLELKSIILNIKNLIKNNYKINLEDNDFIVYHRKSNNGINKYHINLKYKIWSNTFFNLMVKQDNKIFDTQIYKGKRSLRNPYCYKMEFNDLETSSSFFYKSNFYITQDTRYNRIDVNGNFINDNFKIKDSIISFIEQEYKILGNKEDFKESLNKNHLPKIVFQTLEYNKNNIRNYLEKKLSEKITGEILTHNFLKYNQRKNIYEFKFTNIKRKCGCNSHCDCLNKFYICPDCDNYLSGNGFLKLSDNNYTCFHYQNDCKGFKIIDIEEEDFNNEINNILSQIKYNFEKQNEINFKENHINYISGIPGAGKTYKILSELLKTDKINLIIVNRSIQAYSIKNEIKNLTNEDSYIIDQKTFEKMHELPDLLRDKKNIICLSPSIWKLSKLFDCDILIENQYNLFIDEYIQYVENICINSSDNKKYTNGIRLNLIPQLINESYSCFISDVIFDKESITKHLLNFNKELTFSKFYQARNIIDNLNISNDINLLEKIIEENIKNDIPMFIFCDLKYKLYNIYNKYFIDLHQEDILILESETQEELKKLNEQKHKFILATPTVFSAISIRPYKDNILNRVTIGITHNRIISFYNFINAIQRDRTCKSMYLFSNIFNKINSFIDNKNYSINKDICKQSEIDYLTILGNYSSLNVSDCLNYIPFLKINNEIKLNSKLNSEWFDQKNIINNLSKNLLYNVSTKCFNKIKEFILTLEESLCGFVKLDSISIENIQMFEIFHERNNIEFSDLKVSDVQDDQFKFTDFFQNYIYNFLIKCIDLKKCLPYHLKYIEDNFDGENNKEDFINKFIEDKEDIILSCVSRFNKIIFDYRKENISNLINYNNQIGADSNLKDYIKNKEYIQECENLIKLKEENKETEFWELLTLLFNNKYNEVMIKLKVTINNIELIPEITIKKNQYVVKEIQNKFKFDKTLIKDKYTNKELRDKFNSLDQIRGFINFKYNTKTKINRINMERIKLDEVQISRNYKN